MDPWMLWLVIVGIAIGLLAAWLLLARLPREESDMTAAERRAAATWIGATIERHGGIAPQTLVEEVLELHAAYLREPSLRRETDPYADLPLSPAQPWTKAGPARVPQPLPPSAPPRRGAHD